MAHKIAAVLAYIFGSSLLGLAYGYLVGKMAERGLWRATTIQRVARLAPLILGLLGESVLLFTGIDRKSGPAWLMQPLVCMLIVSSIASIVAAKVARQEIPARAFESANLSIR